MSCLQYRIFLPVAVYGHVVEVYNIRFASFHLLFYDMSKDDSIRQVSSF